jgi:amidase
VTTSTTPGSGALTTADPGVWRRSGTPLRRATGDGALHGVRVAVKDLIAVAGEKTGGGNPTWLAEAAPEPADAVPVAKLRAAGAVVVGIAHTDELAFSLSGINVHYGTPPNPRAPHRVPGGSTSGPASAVASGLADVGLGTDTGGSIRVPASVCGLYGFRPTHGAVSLQGTLDLAPSFDTVGWLTADPELLITVAETLLPPDAKPAALPSRVLVLNDLLAALPGGVEGAASATVVARAHNAASAWGATLVLDSAPLPDDPAELLAAFRAVQAAQGWALRGPWIEAHPGALAPDVESRFRYGATVTPDALAAAEAVIHRTRHALREFTAGGTWMALPAAGGPGPERDAAPGADEAWRQGTLRCTVLAGAAGLPCVVVPAVPGPENGPLGVAFVGPAHGDLTLLGAVTASSR